MAEPMTSRGVGVGTRFPIWLGWLGILCLLPAAVFAQTVPPVPIPPENPWTAEKAVLGKIIFWDQQLSTDQTVSCGHCHAPAAGGVDPVLETHPGPNGTFGDSDDITGSIGVNRRDMTGALIADPVFGMQTQITGRAAPNFFGGLWASALFYDGRADDEFRDPLTGDVVIATGGAVENQSLGPLLSDVEMAKEGRTWAEVTQRLGRSSPLAMATDWPPDVTAAIASFPTYQALFLNAFGDPAITPVRIAFALASYERTLVADQTPWDDFMAGNPSALTALEEDGWNDFNFFTCVVCHAPPLFTDNSFRSVGVRDPQIDPGREAITADPADRGAFKVPTLRNSGLKPTFMHTGEFTTLADVMNFYRPGHQHEENLDPLLPVPFNIDARQSIAAFIAGGLTDPRVAGELPPFDRPTLQPRTVPEPGLGGALPFGVALLWAISPSRRRGGSAPRDRGQPRA